MIKTTFIVDMMLPSLRYVTVKYLQQILEKTKKHFIGSQTSAKTIPNHQEFSVKHILDKGKYIDRQMIEDYFPYDP